MLFGERLLMLMSSKSITQAELAKAVGVSPTCINRYVKCGRSKISIPILSSIASVLDTTLEELVFETELEDRVRDVTNENMFAMNSKFVTSGAEFVKDYDDLILELVRSFTCLNETGKIEAVIRVREMTMIDQYRKTKGES